MGRPTRIDYAGAWHHVMNRGARRQAIFRSDADHRSFLALLGEAHDRFGIEVHAFALMGNHFHLLIRSALGNLGDAMRHVGGVHAARFNEHHGLDGPLYRGRYKALLVDSDEYLLQVSRYIHLNPVEANMVARAENHQWSSMPVYAGLAPRPGWLFTGSILAMVGSRRSYLQFVGLGIDTDTRRLYDDAERTGVIGSATSPPSTCAPHDGSTVTMRQVVASVACQLGVNQARVVEPRRGQRSVGRLAALWICHYEFAIPAAQIAPFFRYRSASGVSNALARLRAEMVSNPGLHARIDRLRLVCANSD